MMQTETRLFYIDNLRVALTILVIAHHVGQAYGPTGGYWPVQEAARAALLGPFFTVNRSFFMSLFFMISGYFMVAAYEHGGPGAFIRSRLTRLGVPFLVYAAIMIPLRIFMFGEHITRWNDLINAQHLWYIQHLLLFSLGYAAWRWIRRNKPAAQKAGARLPGTLAILAFAVVLAAASALVRLWSPIDRWMNLLGFFRVAFADVPRDLGFFIIGAVAFPRAWFTRYPARSGYVWLGVGVGAAALWYAYSLWLHALVPLGATAMGIVYPVWEAILCCGMCIGLVVLFRETLDSQGRLGRLLAANQYAAYVWHPMLIVPLQLGILGLQSPPFAKFAVITAIGVPIVFLWSFFTRQARFMRAAL